jgi:hypothetical protein
MVLVAVVVVMAVPAVFVVMAALLGRMRAGIVVVRVQVVGSLDDLVEFTAVQPNAPAGGAIIDFDFVSGRHHQRSGLANGTEHVG